MPKVIVTITGSFSNRDASIDDEPLFLVGTGAAQSAAVPLGKGSHSLKWVVTGAPKAAYKVALSGDTDSWSDGLTMLPEGRDAGIKPFEVK